MSLRGCAIVLMGKNTMMRKAIRAHLENNPALEKLLPHIVNNVGFVFTNEDLCDVRDKLLQNKRGLLLVPVPLLHAPSPSLPRTPVLVLRRPVSSRLCRSQPRLPGVPLKS